MKLAGHGVDLPQGARARTARQVRADQMPQKAFGSWQIALLSSMRNKQNGIAYCTFAFLIGRIADHRAVDYQYA